MGSPYLYIICTEGLSALIKYAECSGHIHGVKLCRGNPIITHLLFADDKFLFMRANENEVTYIKYILNSYELASRQAINLSKSEFLFSSNVPPNIRLVLANIMRVHERYGVGKYH